MNSGIIRPPRNIHFLLGFFSDTGITTGGSFPFKEQGPGRPLFFEWNVTVTIMMRQRRRQICFASRWGHAGENILNERSKLPS